MIFHFEIFDDAVEYSASRVDRDLKPYGPTNIRPVRPGPIEYIAFEEELTDEDLVFYRIKYPSFKELGEQFRKYMI